MIKQFLLSLVLTLSTINAYADDLNMFQKYAREAALAHSQGDMDLCFNTEEKIISLFISNRSKYVSNKDICDIVFESCFVLAFLDESRTTKSACDILLSGLELIDDNPSWVKGYAKKNYIVDCFVKLIGNYCKLGETDIASSYNEKMISFAETYYRVDLTDVLFDASFLYSDMGDYDRRYLLYQRLYGMFDELDRFQQYDVVGELIYSAYQRGKYSEVVSLGLKHEKLIARAKEDSKINLFNYVSSGYINMADEMADEAGNVYSVNVDNEYQAGINWALRHVPGRYLRHCIEYAYWLNGLDDYKTKAVEQFRICLKILEESDFRVEFDEPYYWVNGNLLMNDVEFALTSILVQDILKAPIPKDLNSLLAEYPKTVSAIKQYPNSDFYKDFEYVLQLIDNLSNGNE